MKYSSNVLKLFALWVLLMVFACSPGKKQDGGVQKSGGQVIELPVDGQLLFTGKDLEGWEITQFGTQGPVTVSEGKIVLGMGDGCTGITFKGAFPEVNYEVTLDARKTSGNDFFCGMTFPVNESFCSLIVGGWGGPVVGLSCIDGLDASENETRILKRFDKKVWYKIRLRVTDKKITAWIDGEQLVDFAYPGRELYVRPEVELSKPFGICSWITTAELKNIVLKKLG